MKTIKMFLIVFIFLLFYQTTTYAAGSSSSGEPSVYDAIQKGEKSKPTPAKKDMDSPSPSLFPLFIKFIFSFILVIALLLLLLRYLSKRSKLVQPNGPVLPLGGHLVGNNRSVQVLLIGKTIYIVGVGENVNLIHTISQGEEYQHLLESYENQTESSPTSWLPKDSIKKWDSIFNKHLKNMKHLNGEE
jgi:flagellar protein FliO/FliZ